MSGPVEALLTRARARITPREAWTQGSFARGPGDGEVDADSSRAVCWCAMGAVFAENGGDHDCGAPAIILLTEAMYGTPNPTGHGDGVDSFNDEHDHSTTLAAFDRAIALAKERGL